MRAFILCLCLAWQLAAATVSSPNGRLVFRLDAGSRLTYTVHLNRRPVVEASSIGILLDGVDLGRNAKLKKTATSRGGATFEFDRFTVEVRVFDAGVAFRYVVPGAAASRVPDEATTFRLPAGSTVWFHDFSGHYEGIHKKYPIGEVKAGEWAAPPVTFQLPGGAGYASITEAALRDYAGMALQADGQGGFAARLGHAVPPGRPFTLRYTEADVKRLAIPAAFPGAITTPWRVVLAGRDLNALVNSGVIAAVSPPPAGDFSWVKPGRAVWRYLDGGEATLAGVKEFSRLAGELGFEYQVIEGFWAKWTADELRDAVEFSKQRGVRLFVWRHCREVRDPEARRALFARLRDAGVAGVKLDFLPRGQGDDRSLPGLPARRRPVPSHGQFPRRQQKHWREPHLPQRADP